MAAAARAGSVVLWAVLLLASARLAGRAEARGLHAAGPEYRAVWVHYTALPADEPSGDAAVSALADRLAKAHVNLVFVWVTSDYLVALEQPWFARYAPQARWDAVGRLIRALTLRGVECDLWFAPSEYRRASSPDFDSAAGGNPAWRAVGASGDARPGGSNTADVCLQHEDARAWELRLLLSALDRYREASGVQIEEPGYTTADECVCDLCRSLYRRRYGSDIAADIGTERASRFKCDAVTTFMRSVRQALARRDPLLRLSANGSDDRKADLAKGRDWATWARRGYVDFFVPLIYTADPDGFGDRLASVVRALPPRFPVVVGIGVVWGGGRRNSVAGLLSEVAAVRQQGGIGVSLFPGQAITEAQIGPLLAGPFRSKVGLPPKRR